MLKAAYKLGAGFVRLAVLSPWGLCKLFWDSQYLFFEGTVVFLALSLNRFLQNMPWRFDSAAISSGYKCTRAELIVYRYWGTESRWGQPSGGLALPRHLYIYRMSLEPKYEVSSEENCDAQHNPLRHRHLSGHKHMCCDTQRHSVRCGCSGVVAERAIRMHDVASGEEPEVPYARQTDHRVQAVSRTWLQSFSCVSQPGSPAFYQIN